MSEKQLIGRYEIVSELGRGGMGVVFKAWEESLQRFVAIKMLGDQLTDDESLVTRFLREARAVADLNHPNVVQVFTVDKHDGRPYFAMEYVEGESLTELIRTSRRVDPKRAVQLLKEVATGLGAAHDKGVVHRDIKPDNIMLTKHGGVKVVDFGVAKVEDPNTKLTATGLAVGTPNYVSPEVCLGLEIDKRSDLFSLGVVFYEMLTGDTPFNADSPLEMLTKVAHADIPDITAINPQIDAPVRLILHHLLEKKAEHRYQDAHQLVRDIDSYLKGSNPTFAMEAREKPTMQVAQIGGAQATTSSAEKSTPQRVASSGYRVEWIVPAVLVLGSLIIGAWWYLGNDSTAPAGDPVKQAEVAEQTDAIAEQLPDAVDDARTAGDGDPLDDTPADAVADQAAEPVTPVTDDRVVSPPETGTIVVEQEPSPAAAQSPTVDNSVVANSAGEPAPTPLSSPRLVVTVSGDPTIASVVESVFENALSAADFGVIDEQFISGLSSAADLASMRQAVLADGGNIMVIAELLPAGQRELNYSGRREMLMIASLQVRAVLLEERRNLGAPWTQSLEYVALNAPEKARAAAEPIANELVIRLRDLVASQ
jgi:serine/threonine-protein kinase